MCQEGLVVHAPHVATHTLSISSPHHTHTCPACAHLIHTHTLAYTHTCCHPVVSILSSSYRACAQMSHTHTHTHTLHGHRHTVGSKPQGFPSEIRNQPQIWRIKRDQRNRPPLQLVGDDSHKQGNLRTMLVLAAAKHIDLHTCLPET